MNITSVTDPVRNWPAKPTTLPTTILEHIEFYRSVSRFRGCKSDAGYIYALHLPESGAVKIGRTIDPAARIKTYQTAHPRPLRFTVIIASLAPIEDERQIHERFHALRLQGEWFRDAQDLLDWICEPHPHRVPETPPFA